MLRPLACLSVSLIVLCTNPVFAVSAGFDERQAGAGRAGIPAGTTPARHRRVIDDKDRIRLHGTVHQHARPENDLGTASSTLPMTRMIVTLRLPPGKDTELERLLTEQQDPASPNFHRWLTPEEFGERFGPEIADVAAVSGWLTSKGLTVDEVAKSRTWINCSGPAAAVETALQTEIHTFFVNGKIHHANVKDPTIPRSLSDVVSGVVSLHDFRRKPMHTGMRRLAGVNPEYTWSSGRHSIAPGDFALIYNVQPLYDAGIDGSGQTIAIAGRTNPSPSNWSFFRKSFGLPVNTPEVIVNGADPGDQGEDENGEADLDVEWAGAVARNAAIKLVVSDSTASTDGIDLSAQYIVENNLAPVMSVSFGLCEMYMGSSNAFYNNLWRQAAAQGITVFIASGDSGAAGCETGNAPRGSAAAVSGMASTPYNVAVGGTQLNDTGGGYWNVANANGYTSARGYIPEKVWNESSLAGGYGLWSSGGGASSLYGTPVWQVAPGVPADGRRSVPDVSLASASHDGYLVRTQGYWNIMSGTSVAAPSFAGLMALVVQKTGERQGNANARLYELATAQYAANGPAVFHDIVEGNNSVPGVSGVSAGKGYDRATGLGSVDANALVAHWVPATAPQFAVGVTIAGSGSVSPAGVQKVASGQPLSLVLTPGSGSAVSTADGCGGSLSGRVYTTAPVTTDCTISVTFRTSASQPQERPGDLTGDGVLDLSDALQALRIAAGLIAPTPDDLLRGDVSPMTDGKPSPDGVIDMGDALTLLKAVVGVTVL